MILFFRVRVCARVRVRMPVVVRGSHLSAVLPQSTRLINSRLALPVRTTRANDEEDERREPTRAKQKKQAVAAG